MKYAAILSIPVALLVASFVAINMADGASTVVLAHWWGKLSEVFGILGSVAIPLCIIGVIASRSFDEDRT